MNDSGERIKSDMFRFPVLVRNSEALQKFAFIIGFLWFSICTMRKAFKKVKFDNYVGLLV